MNVSRRTRGTRVDAFRATAATTVLLVLVAASLLGGAFLHPRLAVATEAPPQIVPVRVVGALHQAVAFTFDPAGRIWFVEKAEGDVRIYDPGTQRNSLFFRVPDVFAETEQGLVGIELDPGFPARPYVYLYATRLVDGSLRDQLLRVRDRSGRGAGLRVLWDSPASSSHEHSGGRLLFGPDGALYITVGDALEPAAAQDPASERGKILRMTPEADPAPGNPFPDSRVYASGFRNSFGIAFDPVTGSLWETENGPSCNDEVNRVLPGANYGWGPNASCPEEADPTSTNVDGNDRVPPELTFTPTIAPTGIAFCSGCDLGHKSEGALFFGDYNDGAIHRATLDEDRKHIVSDEVVAHGPDLALSLEVGPDGALYFSSYIAIFRLELRGSPRPQVSPPTASPSPSVRSPSASPSGSPAQVDSRRSGAGGVALALLGLLAIVLAVLALMRRR
jgi:glucose/arabinose dehydrogenase